MPTNVNYQVPFLPQEGITQQVLAAIALAHEQNYKRQQLALQQQAQPSEIALRQAQTGQAGATTEATQQETQLRKIQLDLQRRMFGYVFGNPDAAQTPTSQQKPNSFADDMASTKARLELNPEESAAYDSAVKQVQVGMLSTGKLDTAPIEKVIQSHLSRTEKTATTLTKTQRHEGTDPTQGWWEDARTADGKLAFSAPIPPPADMLPTVSQGTDIIRATDANTGQVTATPVDVTRTTQKTMGSQAPMGAPAPAPQGGTATPGKPFAVAGGGKKLSEAGQTMVTSLTQANDFIPDALKFFSDNKPSYTDWQKAHIQYAAGANPGPEYANVFQGVGMLRAIATGPLLHGIRNREVIKGIQDHLPSLWDGPSLVEQKLRDLQPFWKRAIDEVYKTEQVKQPAQLSDSAAQYLKSAGVNP